MNRTLSLHTGPLRRLLFALGSVVALLCGCGSDTGTTEPPPAAGAPIYRYDVIQAIASHGKTVVAGTQTGALIVSHDGGNQWRRNELGQASVLDIAACGDASFIAIDYYHKLWFSDAAVQQWTAVPLKSPETPIAVACDPSGGWWISGTRAVIAGSRDRGAHWEVTDFGKDIQLTALQFINNTRAIAVGEFGFTAYSDDGGRSWRAGTRLPGEFYPYAMLFSGDSEAWVSGIAGQILHTRDGGRSWRQQDNTGGQALYRLFMLDGVPHGVGNGGALLALDGDRWRKRAYPDAVPVFLGGGAALQQDNAVVIGGPGGLLRKLALAGR